MSSKNFRPVNIGDVLQYRLLTSEEIASLMQYYLTQGDTPWNLYSISDQVADKFYQQVIAAENHNAIYKVTLLKLIFFDLSDLRETHLKGKPAHLVFHADTIKDCMTTSIVLILITVKHYLARLIMKNYPFILLLEHMMSFNTLYNKLQT
jgi:hypothetical protein